MARRPIGYELHPELLGQGLMTEAVRAVVACGHETFRLNRIDAWTMPGNAASDRVLEKSGFQYEGTLRKRRGSKARSMIFECSAGSREMPRARTETPARPRRSISRPRARCAAEHDLEHRLQERVSM
jgi:hypothetical protein